MKDFGDFNIKPATKGFQGEKISINKVINVNIIVERFEVNPSNFKEKGDRLDLQIMINNTPRLIFISSKSLIEMIRQVPAEGFPFKTKIIKEDSGRLVFSKSDN
jgi:hypothetical protein